MSDVYRIWRLDYDELDEPGKTRSASSIREAAERQADWDHARRDGWEWSWPVTYLVEESSGVRWEVEVERHTVPEFEAGKPKGTTR